MCSRYSPLRVYVLAQHSVTPCARTHRIVHTMQHTQARSQGRTCAPVWTRVSLDSTSPSSAASSNALAPCRAHATSIPRAVCSRAPPCFHRHCLWLRGKTLALACLGVWPVAQMRVSVGNFRISGRACVGVKMRNTECSLLCLYMSTFQPQTLSTITHSVSIGA